MMRIKKTDITGTIHDLTNQLVNLAALDEIVPKTMKQKLMYRRKFEKYHLFHANTSNERKREIIANLKVMNFDENEIIRQNEILKSIEKFNRIVNKKRRELEDEASSGKNMRRNDSILAGRERVEIDIPRDVRNNLRIREKAIKLRPFGKSFTRNKILFYSGQNYDFVVKTGFGQPIRVPYDELQRLRRQGLAIPYLLNLFQKQVETTRDEDRRKYEKKKPKQWKQKRKVYEKIIQQVLEHNFRIATQKEYNKPFVKRDADGTISDKDSEIPILMKISHDVIELYIP